MTGEVLCGHLIAAAMSNTGLALSFLVPFALGVALTYYKRDNT